MDPQQRNLSPLLISTITLPQAHVRLLCLSRVRALILQISILYTWEGTNRSKNCGVSCSTYVLPSSPPPCIRLRSTRQLLTSFKAQGQGAFTLVKFKRDRKYGKDRYHDGRLDGLWFMLWPCCINISRSPSCICSTHRPVLSRVSVFASVKEDQKYALLY